ncbi:HAD-IA family hydrolase [Vibrio lentus]|uniref:Haloacid dehalogenase n=1 Tax=Vibrio lentus TaxID=136468 RepID=A0A855IVV6_9VIBR|nr:HAD-IA family hydrolase [Vibrio lentus]PMJ65419.1 haloacid dehalogenase [Vibrio lentus]PMM60339.1 haloacid dehalogenase [Vibrio lentus]PMM61384.1 haloacid dehalogenase [Vibrio lentus]
MNTFVCKGFIFDVDATLVDTTQVINNIWRKWATQNAIEFSKVLPHVHGRKISETLALVGSKDSNPEEEAVVKKIAMEAMNAATEIDGALDFVSNIPLHSWGIATSGPRKVAETSLRASGFQIPANMICAEDVTNGKPHPDPFLLAAQNLGLDAGNCVAFEDSPAGVKSAKDAGCFTVAILTSHEKEDLLSADLIVDGFSELTLKRRNNQYELCW